VHSRKRFFKKKTSLWQQRDQYSGDVLTQRFLFATLSRSGYRSFKPRLLRLTIKPEALSEPCGHRQTLKEYGPLSAVTPLDDQYAFSWSQHNWEDRFIGCVTLTYEYIGTSTKYRLCEDCLAVVLRHFPIWPHFLANPFDLSPFELFLWRCLSSKAGQTRLAGLRNLKQRISEDNNSTLPAMLTGFGKCY